MNKKGFGLLSLLITLGIMLFLILGGAGFYFFRSGGPEIHKSFIEKGQDAIEQSEELKNIIENRNLIEF